MYILVNGNMILVVYITVLLRLWMLFFAFVNTIIRKPSRTVLFTCFFSVNVKPSHKKCIYRAVVLRVFLYHRDNSLLSACLAIQFSEIVFSPHFWLKYKIFRSGHRIIIKLLSSRVCYLTRENQWRKLFYTKLDAISNTCKLPLPPIETLNCNQRCGL